MMSESKSMVYMRSCGAEARALPGTPPELLPFACYMPDGGCFPSGKIAAKPRMVSFPTRFSRQFATVLADILAQPYDALQYEAALDGIMRAYSTGDMVKNALASCTISPAAEGGA